MQRHDICCDITKWCLIFRYIYYLYIILFIDFAPENLDIECDPITATRALIQAVSHFTSLGTAAQTNIQLCRYVYLHFVDTVLHLSSGL